MPILVEGRLKLDTWETDGQKRSKLKVVGERMQMLPKNGKASTNSNDAPTAEPVTVGAPAGEEIPF